jgi:hypothetical protein
MAILNVDITDISRGSKYDREQAFLSWNKERCPKPNTFFFEGEKQVIKGKELTWKVTSFGDYIDASGNSRRFIAYRCGVGNLTRMYSWVYDWKNNSWTECQTQSFGSY